MLYLIVAMALYQEKKQNIIYFWLKEIYKKTTLMKTNVSEAVIREGS